MEVSNTVNEAVTQTSPKNKKIKWLSKEALQIVEERQKVKSKGERTRYTQLGTEYQRVASRG